MMICTCTLIKENVQLLVERIQYQTFIDNFSAYLVLKEYTLFVQREIALFHVSKERTCLFSNSDAL